MEKRFIPKGAFCVHRRMKYASCGDYDLVWMLYEGIYG